MGTSEKKKYERASWKRIKQVTKYSKEIREQIYDFIKKVSYSTQKSMRAVTFLYVNMYRKTGNPG